MAPVPCDCDLIGLGGGQGIHQIFKSLLVILSEATADNPVSQVIIFKW